ncbi:MAG: tyrosine-type recombinase/integrase [Candidatus Pacebacteria bacterium]|nr:tyrosine-type recombinase/integrase [Candidatus Paceibacterota bacterium]
MDFNLKPIIEYIPNFLEYLDIEKGLSNNSQQTYSRMLEKFSQWLKKNNFQNLKPNELTEEHIWAYRVFLSHSPNLVTHEPLKKSTQNHYLIALRNLLNFFSDRNIQALPSSKIKLAKQTKEKSVKFLNLDQVEKLILAPKTNTLIGLRDRAIIETLFSAGLRVAELVSLNKEQIRLNSGSGDMEVGIVGKGNRPRTVYFSERCLEWLQKYLDTRGDDKEKALFIHFKGPKRSSARLTSRSVENIIKKYAVLAGIPVSTVPHTIRHSFATDLLAKGVDLRLVQEFLGHRNIATTQIYTHVVSKQLRDVHRKFHSGKEIKNN